MKRDLMILEEQTKGSGDRKVASRLGEVWKKMAHTGELLKKMGKAMSLASDAVRVFNGHSIFSVNELEELWFQDDDFTNIFRRQAIVGHQLITSYLAYAECYGIVMPVVLHETREDIRTRRDGWVPGTRTYNSMNLGRDKWKR